MPLYHPASDEIMDLTMLPTGIEDRVQGMASCGSRPGDHIQPSLHIHHSKTASVSEHALAGTREPGH